MELLEENELLAEEKKVLMAQIEKEQSNLSQYHDRQALANAEKQKLEDQLAETQKQRLAAQEKESKAALSTKKCLENEGMAVRKDIGDIEVVRQKLEQDKSATDKSFFNHFHFAEMSSYLSLFPNIRGLALLNQIFSVFGRQPLVHCIS